MRDAAKRGAGRVLKFAVTGALLVAAPAACSGSPTPTHTNEPVINEPAPEQPTPNEPAPEQTPTPDPDPPAPTPNEPAATSAAPAPSGPAAGS